MLELGYKIEVFSEFAYNDKNAAIALILSPLERISKSGDVMFRNININADFSAGLARIEFSGLWWERESAAIRVIPNVGTHIIIEPIMDKKTAWAIVDILRGSRDGHLWRVSAESIMHR